MADKAAVIITADTQSGLGKIVGTKAEELGFGCDFRSSHASAGQLDHRTNKVFNSGAFFSKHLFSNGMNQFNLSLKFRKETNKRNHDFRLNGNSFFGNITSSFDNRTSLHFSDFGEHIA